jgi:hypothetical protein
VLALSIQNDENRQQRVASIVNTDTTPPTFLTIFIKHEDMKKAHDVNAFVEYKLKFLVRCWNKRNKPEVALGKDTRGLWKVYATY